MLLILFHRVYGQVVVGAQHGIMCIMDEAIMVLPQMRKRLFGGAQQTIPPNQKNASIIKEFLFLN